MKKIICLIIGLCLLFSSAYAEGVITFQGVPWLSDEMTTLKILTDGGFLREGFIYPVFSGDSGYYIMKEESLGYCQTRNESYKDVNYSISLAGKTKRRIAGCLVKDVILTFVNDRTSAKLICVKVVLNGIKYNELKEKLTKAYGKETEINKDDEFETVIWKGDDNSAIILFTENDGFSYQLTYGRLDSEQILEESLNSISVPADPGDVSGL